MLVGFLTTEQELNYGRYVAEPNDVQLARYFHLDERDLAFINQRRGRHNRLGIALQLTSARFLGTFLTDLTRVLPGVQQFVAVQLNIRRPEVLSRYAERDTTLREHTALIKEYYGYHEFGDFPWSFRLKRLLYTRAWLRTGIRLNRLNSSRLKYSFNLLLFIYRSCCAVFHVIKRRQHPLPDFSLFKK